MRHWRLKRMNEKADEVDRRQLDIRTACHLWTKQSWWYIISQLEERNQREAFIVLWYNGFQKVYLSLYPRKIQIMQPLSPKNWVIRTLILLSLTVFWYKKSWKFGLFFLMFCTQISLTFSNQTMSTSIICVSVLVSSLMNIQKQNMINNFHVRVRTGKQKNIRLLENGINFSIVKLSWKSHIAL